MNSPIDGEPCYFIIKKATATEEARMAPICVDCHNEFMLPAKKTGWYWDEGFKHEYDVICDSCGKYIRKFEKNAKKEKTKTSG
jgi:hypothetical protein